MELRIDGNQLVVTKEKSEKGFYASRSAWGDAESAFLYHVKEMLNKPDCKLFLFGAGLEPVQWVKKRMWKDGHMVDELEQYLRSKNPVAKCKDGTFVYLCIYSDHWAIVGLDKDFNEGEARLVFTKITICRPELNKHDHARIAEQSDKNMAQIDRELGIE